jgi:sporulation protein YlmC with PRC-barrel domain
MRTSSRLSTLGPAILLLLLAGGTQAAIAQSQPSTPTTPTSMPVVAHAASNATDFRSSKWMIERDVTNDNNESIATVTDLILDRGWGRIEYVVITTGSVLGMGGRAIAVPYAAFRWEAGNKDRFILATTPEQIKAYPEFTSDSWKALKSSQLDSKSALRQRLESDAALPSDPYIGAFTQAETSHIEGTITKVERNRTSNFGEHIVITVQPNGQPANQNLARVTLGPSWYVNGSSNAPMRGDSAIIETLTLPRDPDQLLVAKSVKIGGRTLQLRDKTGTPSWALASVDADGYSYSRSFSRYLLLSTIPGMKVDCRGKETGKVYDVIIDRNSGEACFLSIDPNQNFLGINDTKRLLPWSIATATLEGGIRIDASKAMVLASSETPKDLAQLNSTGQTDGIYKAFDVTAPRMDHPKPVGMVPMPNSTSTIAGTTDAWSAQGIIIGAIESNSSRTLEGKVVGMTEVSFDNGVKTGRAMQIRMNGGPGSEETILLGPTWYMDNQKSMCAAGDAVKLEVCRTTIDGHRYWIAKSIDCKDNRVVLLDASNAPAWDR